MAETRVDDVIRRARLYVCSDARDDAGDLRAFTRAAFAGGVDILQVRDKRLDAADELAALEVVAEEAERAGALFAVNDRADVAALCEAPVFHVGQRDLSTAQARRFLPSAVIGRSTHSAEQWRAADADPELGYFCVGPVWATPTKPGRAAVGLGLVADAAAGAGKPWFAIGGVDEANVAEVVDAGATRIVVVRAVTQADDPEQAARRLRDALPDAGE